MILTINIPFLASLLCISLKRREYNNNVRSGVVRDEMSVNCLSIYLNSYKQPDRPAVLAPSTLARRNIPHSLPI